MARIEADKANWVEFKAKVRESQEDWTLTNDEILRVAIQMIERDKNPLLENSNL